MGATTVGNPVNVTTGVSVTTLPVSSPVVVISDGNHADSYWNLVNGTLLPDTLTDHVGLGLVDDGALTDHVLLYDTAAREIKKIDGSLISPVSHTQAWSTITATPTTLANYGITDQLQPLDADLTAIAALGYASTSFLKKTGANTWELDTTVYSATSHTHNYEPLLDQCPVEGYVLSGAPNGDRTWIPMVTVGGGEGVAAHDELTGLSDDDHAQYALLLGRNNDVYHVDNIHEYTAANGVIIDGVTLKDTGILVDTIVEKTASNGVLIEGVLLKDGDVIAYSA